MGMDWIDLAENRDAWGSCECDTEPSGSVICRTFLG
jgi:hypothetical protein